MGNKENSSESKGNGKKNQTNKQEPTGGRSPSDQSALIGSLSNDDCNGNENVTWKYIFISFVLLRDYFNSLNFYKNGELSKLPIGNFSNDDGDGNDNATKQ